MQRALAVIVAMAGTAAADAPKEVNLLTSVPTTVAVSSTVANKTILPAHLVDGKLDTAWNSLTGELEGSWVAVRLPKTVKVTKLRLTAGFTKTDPKLGDLFTMNPRLRTIRIRHDGRWLQDTQLDPESRALQDVPLYGLPGGDIEVSVVDLVPGTKESWREVNLSELEVWGTLEGTAASPQKPVIKVGSFDGRLSRAECVRAMKESTTDITEHRTEPFASDVEACVVRHGGEGMDAKGTIDVALVKHGAKGGTLVAKLSPIEGWFHAGMSGTGPQEEARVVDVEALPLTTTETALLVHIDEHTSSPSFYEGKKVTRLYRLAGAKLTQVLELQSSSRAGETSDMSECSIVRPGIADALPDLDVHCLEGHSAYPGDKSGGDRDRQSESTTTYTWKAGRYAKKR